MKKQLLIYLILVLVLGLGLGGGKVLAQTSPPQEIKLATTVDLPIQGRLLTASGVPVNGGVEAGFRLYSAATDGTLYCEDYHAFNVTNGLYSTTLQCPRQYLDGRDLYLAVKLEGDDEMTPRQKILPVAYAVSFLPGAFVQDAAGTGPVLALAGSNPGLPGAFYAINGDAQGIAAWLDNSSASDATLVVRNMDTDGPLFKGFSGSGEDYDFQISSSGSIESQAISTLTIPGSNIHINNPCANPVYLSDGSLRVTTTSPSCSFSALLSMELPATLYGTNVRVEGFTFYLYTTSSDAYIDALQINVQNTTSAMPFVMAESDLNYFTPGIYSSFSIFPTAHALLGPSYYGPVTMKFDCILTNNTSYIELRSVRVSLSHYVEAP